MTTQILQLPKLMGGGASAWSIANNADWLDSIFFAAPNSPSEMVLLNCETVAGSDTITTSVTDTLAPGQPVSGSMIPPTTFIGAILSTEQFTLVDQNGDPVEATADDLEANLVISPIPLDLSGITFKAALRSAPGTPEIYLAVSTDDGTFINTGKGGVLAFNVRKPAVAKVFPGVYVLDILAEADGYIINLFPEAPGTVTVIEGITTP